MVVAAHRSGRPLCSTSDQAADRRPFGSEASLRSLKIAVANRNPPAAGRGRERTSWDLFRVGRRSLRTFWSVTLNSLLATNHGLQTFSWLIAHLEDDTGE